MKSRAAGFIENQNLQCWDAWNGQLNKRTCNLMRNSRIFFFFFKWGVMGDQEPVKNQYNDTVWLKKLCEAVFYTYT